MIDERVRSSEPPPEVPIFGCVPTPGVSSMPRVFTWADSSDVLDALEALNLRTARGRFDRAVNEIACLDPELATSIASCLADLPAPAFARFILAPEVIARTSLLRAKPKLQIPFLCMALKAERMLSGGGLAGEDCWTALGDYYLSRSARADMKSGKDVPASTELVAFSAPRLSDSIALDFSSPNAQIMDSHGLPFEPYGPEEIAAVAASLQNLFLQIVRVSQGASELITRFVKVIVLRKHTSEGHSSSSMRTYPGRVLLRNPQAADSSRLASSLIHEAIHHTLYVVEYSGEFVMRGFQGETIRSPWTGNNIPVHSYLHACFVWYGLASFWRLPAAAEIFPASSAQRELRRALSGFQRGNPLDALHPYAQEIRPEALKAVGALHDRLSEQGALNGDA